METSQTQPSDSLAAWEKAVPRLLILAGAAIFAVGAAADLLGLGGGTGLGANQVALALSGLALLITGVGLTRPPGLRRLGEWFLVLAAVAVAALAADLFVIGSLANAGAKQAMLASVLVGLALTAAWPLPAAGRPFLADWLGWLALNRVKVARFLAVTLQLGLLVLIMGRYQLENQAVYHNLMLLVLYGFLIHHFLPLPYRLPFFLLLSLVAIAGILGLANGAWLIAIGLALIAIANLPLSHRLRLGLLLAAAAGLAWLRRAGGLEMGVPAAVWPVLGSIFMFRLIIYWHDLKHAKERPNVWQTLSYFFLLPNVVFPFFPVVDFGAFRRTYFNTERYQIYQTGVQWIFRGVTQLILYRFVNYYVAIAPEEVVGATSLARFVLSGYLLYLRVTGQFHVIIGILHLFGFNLPETNYRYYLASSFTDLWRRANIYWKDFMQKVFFYPAHYRMRRLPPAASLFLATVFVIVVTWALHAYQWFWLRGSLLLSLPDITFWTILGTLLVINVMVEARRGRKRSLSAAGWSWASFSAQTLRTAGVFLTVAVLWSLWSSPSLGDWASLWPAAVRSPLDILQLLLIAAGVVIVIGLAIWFYHHWDRRTGPKTAWPASWRPVALNLGAMAAVLLLGQPAVQAQLGGRAGAVLADLTVARLSDRDAALLQRGYYEDLLGIDQFNSDLWEIYTKRPADWPLLQETQAARMTGDFRVIELIPSTQIDFHGAQFTVNRWGMRDKDYELIPAADTYRIAMLGPSYVMGSGVADEETFDWQLEERLNAELAAETGLNYELLNFGVAGYSVLQELLQLENTALAFRPQALFLVAHHLEEDMVVRNLANSARMGQEIPYDYFSQIATQAGVTEGMSQAEAERRLQPFTDPLLSWSYNHIVEIARQNGILPVWIYITTPELTAAQEDIAYLSRLAEGAGFVVLNLADVYAGRDLEALIVAEWDRHPNARGHRLIADRLYQELLAHPEAIPMDRLSPAGLP